MKEIDGIPILVPSRDHSFRKATASLQTVVLDKYGVEYYEYCGVVPPPGDRLVEAWVVE